MPAQSQAAPTSPATRAPFFRRIWVALVLLVLLLAAVLIPPYLNVNRLQRRITASISASLGRPVHLDNVTLTLLPIPGFTLDNFVVSEDPAFGFEPTIRANTVSVRLRASTLWHRRIEISRITFTDPSVNLVHTADGKWNLDSILLQAARIPTAPTAQRDRGPSPRFPYIEATGARLNLKLDQVKTPFSLTESDFSLWLPSPETWHFRITARPARTDVPVGYSGLLHLEGTLGRAPTLSQIPIDLHGEWRAAPLGEVSRILLAQDAGWRGDMTLAAALQGTVGSNALHTTLRLTQVHRTAFVPTHPLILAVDCDATLADTFKSIPQMRCAVPSSSGPPPITLFIAIPDLLHPAPTALHATLAPVSAATLTPILQAFSLRIPPQLALGGILSGAVDCDAPPCNLTRLNATADLEDATLAPTPESPNPILLGNLTFHTPASFPLAITTSRARPGRHAKPFVYLPFPTATLLLTPASVPLGGRDPALLEATLDPVGLTLHLTGQAAPERLSTILQSLPPLADNLPPAYLPPTSKPQSPPPTPPAAPVRLDLTLAHPWSGNPSWHDNLPQPVTPPKRISPRLPR